MMAGGQESVLNGGFETGDFTNWTVVDPSGDTFVDNGSNTGLAPHSGTYFAALGPVGSVGYLSQSLTTAVGQSYLLSLWLNSPDGDTPNEFIVNWNGSTIYDQTNLPATGWRNLQFVVTATGTNTVLQFGSRDDSSYLGLDDVSVLPTPAGTLKTTLAASYTNVATGFTVNFTGQIVGQATSSYLDFGDGTVLSNVTSQLNIAHAWVTGGNYPVSLTAYNGSNPGGISTTTVVQVVAGISYVRWDSSNPIAPYTSWATAATNIQDAVDAAFVGGTVLVTNGVYASGGRPANGHVLTNRLTVDKPLTVQSVNGPTVTIIQGYQVPTNIWGDSAVRCAYLTDAVTLAGFTLTNGATQMAGEASGGGAYCDGNGSAILTDCILSGNSAASEGGGAFEGTLNNCAVSGNSATNSYGAGGGAMFSTLNSCSLINNSAWYGGGGYYCTVNGCTLSGNTGIGPYGSGGGVYYGTLADCTLRSNSASNYGGGASWATLNNCTLSNNLSSYDGGGAYNSTLTNCTLNGNSAAYQGGGAYSSTLNNCIVSSNSATDGGGVMFGTLTDCALIGNSANYEGGGSYLGSLNNCIVYYNMAPSGMNYAVGSLSYCCATPMPPGAGNITNAPLFINLAGGDYHLQSNSPCINSGNNAYVSGTSDLDGNPRIQGGTVDIGPYEYQTPSSILSYAWAQQYGLPTDGSVDYLDMDGTGMLNWQKSIAGLNPTNALSVLEMLSPVSTNNPAGLFVSWQSVNNRTYYLQSSTNLAATPAFTTVQSNIVGLIGTTSYTDTNAVGPGPFFYRVGVQ
jgi:hypothetical protein